MTYNVFSGTLKRTQSINQCNSMSVCQRISQKVCMFMKFGKTCAHLGTRQHRLEFIDAPQNWEFLNMLFKFCSPGLM